MEDKVSDIGGKMKYSKFTFNSLITIIDVRKHVQPYCKNSTVGFEEILFDIHFNELIQFQFGQVITPIQNISIECYQSLRTKPFMKHQYVVFEDDIRYLQSLFKGKTIPCNVILEIDDVCEEENELLITIFFTDKTIGKIEGRCIIQAKETEMILQIGNKKIKAK